jgi:thiamine biosynthesis lipoprotein ApbE
VKGSSTVRRGSHTALCTPTRAPATARWEALGTSVVLRVLDPLWLPRASAILTRELDALDRACSRFRPDSDLARVNARAGGRPVQVAPLLIEALQLALRAAELTDGDVDPTVGAALVLAGYDRDWRLLDPAEGPATGRSPSGPPTLTAQSCSGYTTVELDAALGTVRVPRGIVLDLGATAKAWAADRAARAVHEACGCGVLVSLGGDLATAGGVGSEPPGGWRVHVTDDHRAGPLAPGQTVAIASGGLATSSTAVRRWRHHGATMHHLIDPATGVPARGPWRTVSIAAATCADANIAATAALVRQDRAPAWLDRLGLPARLVAHDGAVLKLAGWPAASVAQCAPTRGRTPRAHAPVGTGTSAHADDPQ